MKITKDKLLNQTTAHEDEFLEALDLLVDDINAMVFSGGEQVLKIGKRRFLRIVEK